MARQRLPPTREDCGLEFAKKARTAFSSTDGEFATSTTFAPPESAFGNPHA